ncbi:hypothetical protein LX16_4212 [Stackebrandtia albiflava]|uniref:Uncharacterized protein n=1 Tax=Stackebrandtia albiflava TaxID=406432 RepID=A0A562UZ11_9ACTN|nr:hypothetical protein [Stackebrandtia albiflava]TWJ10788.1 hypothetical protein LX16_4212 [Stackebrandtia albiflava]
MTTNDDLRAIAREVFMAACHAREVERIREYGDTDSMMWPEEDVEGNYRSILVEFEKFTTPDLGGFADIATHLESAITTVSLGDAALLKDSLLGLDGWQGTAKRAFDENYVARWDDYRDIHATLIESLRSAVTVHTELYDRMRDKAFQIGETAKAALEGIDSWPLWLSAKEGAEITVKVAGLVTSALTSVGGKLGTVMIGVVTADTALAGTNAAVTVEGQWVREILDSMHQALVGLDIEISYEEEKIRRTLADNVFEIEERLALIVPPEPELAAVDPNAPGDDLAPTT